MMQDSGDSRTHCDLIGRLRIHVYLITIFYYHFDSFDYQHNES